MKMNQFGRLPGYTEAGASFPPQMQKHLVTTYQNTRRHNRGVHSMSIHRHINYHTCSKPRRLFVSIVHCESGRYFKKLTSTAQTNWLGIC